MFPRRMLLILLLALSGCVAPRPEPTPVVAPPPAPTPAPETVAEGNPYAAYMITLAEQQGFSGAILVARGDEVLFQGAYGMANRSYKVPNTVETRFRIASLSKQFAATAIMLLEEEGRLRVADPICQYLDACPAAWAPITIHHLLTHSAGVGEPPYLELPLQYGSSYSFAAAIATFRDLPLAFAPGARFQYSNEGYTLLGAIVERVSGQPYMTFLQERVLGPAGMADTGNARSYAIIEHLAAGYMRYGTNTADSYHMMACCTTEVALGTLVAAEPTFVTSPTEGGLYATVADLYRWDRALASGRIVKPATVARMRTGYTNDYGYGWFVRPIHDLPAAAHNGGLNGYSSTMIHLPTVDTFVVVLANLGQIATDQYARDLAAIALGKPYAMPPTPRTITVSPAALEGYVGTYAVQGTQIQIAHTGSQLFIALQGGAPAPLQAANPRVFFIDGLDWVLTFTTDASGRATQLKLAGTPLGDDPFATLVAKRVE